MNKSVLILVAVFLTTLSCGSKATENNNNKVSNETSVSSAENSSNTSSQNKGTIKLDKEKFLNRVMDYETNTQEWVYEGNKPALIDFYADWCGPCKITSPILEELADEYAGEIYIYKIDTDVEKELASVFGVRSLPTFLYVPMEGKPYMSAGIARSPEETKQMFRDQIDKYLLNKSTNSEL